MSQDRKYIVFSNEESFTEVLEYLQKEYPDTWKDMGAYRDGVWYPAIELENWVKLSNEMEKDFENELLFGKL